ncbi:MAG: EFR1 family ferrodoxin [bacterium]
MIFYFSGTGNSRHAALSIAQTQKDRIVSIAKEFDIPGNRYEYDFHPGELFGIVFPVHAWGAPQIVCDFVDRIQITGSVPFVFCLATCGAEEGAASAMIRKHLARKRVVLDAAFSVVMPNNYLIGYELDDPAVQAEQLRQADERLTHINDLITRRIKGTSLVIPGKTPRFLTALIHPLFNRFAIRTRPFYATDVCTSCGLCERLCPVHTIKVVGKPIWGKSCTQCLACISGCPVAAIEYGKGSVGKKRYFHPDGFKSVNS